MTDLNPGDQAQWKWGNGHPTGTVAEVQEHGSLSVQSDKGNTITRNADPSNPAVRIEREGNDVVKRASELEKISDGQSTTNSGSEQQHQIHGQDHKEGQPPKEQAQPDGVLHKPFPAPRQSAPITRPPDTEQEKEEANLSLEEQRQLAEQRDAADTNGHTSSNEENKELHPDSQPTMIHEDKMDTREDHKAASPEKQPSLDASVGEKRGRSEEPEAPTLHEPAAVSAENGEPEKVAPAVPEPEAKKARVEEEQPIEEKQEETAKPTTEEPQAEKQVAEKPVENSEEAEPPKKKSGRAKKDESKTTPTILERKTSISTRTRSKASAENISV
ncbi:hypothetical protein ABW20_dc0101161 [Dactylellina cionopaga]|nr:hypothetical protein ABW20_dc0101161 [Dactylellina cionopaga]